MFASCKHTDILYQVAKNSIAEGFINDFLLWYSGFAYSNNICHLFSEFTVQQFFFFLGGHY